MNLTKLMSMSRDEQAAVVASIDPAQIQGRDLKRKFARIQKKKQAGFTLLELLVVVAILALLGGLAIGAYGDKTSQAAKGAATNSIASVMSMVQTFHSTARVLPNDLDTMICAAPGDVNVAATTTKEYGGDSDLPGVGGGMGAKLAGKVEPFDLPTAAGTALAKAGITRLRYGHANSCSDATNVGGAQAAVADADFGAGLNQNAPVNYPTGIMSAIDIPNRGLDFPISATGNRGRGWVLSHTNNTGAEVNGPKVVAVWSPGTAGGNNTKVGAAAKDVLAMFGLGNNATMFTDTSNRVGASAPFYGDVAKDKYSRYMMLVKVGTDADINLATTADFTPSSKASFVTVIDSRGDFLDEEYAEANGQKV